MLKTLANLIYNLFFRILKPQTGSQVLATRRRRTAESGTRRTPTGGPWATPLTGCRGPGWSPPSSSSRPTWPWATSSSASRTGWTTPSSAPSSPSSPLIRLPDPRPPGEADPRTTDRLRTTDPKILIGPRAEPYLKHKTIS